MFGKNNNTYLFPSPSLHHQHHHHPDVDVFSGGLHHYNNVQALVDHQYHYQASAAGFLNNQADDVPAERMLFQKKPTPAKKDRHSKIFTSQGPRDRRVRLSIGIARKFFDLQEMLGFDKPSKTLDWLLTKSKASIKDLVQTKEKSGNDDDDNNNSKSSSSPILPSECELGGNEKGKSGNLKSKGSSLSSASLAKESRAKARARARERTREKMCIKQQLKNGGETNSEVSPVNYVSPVGVFQLSRAGSRNHEEAGSHNHHQQELVQESVLIKRKTKSPNSSFFGFQQNVFVSGSGYVSPFGSGGTHDQNWDVCSLASQANLCAILDQHKFMNSSSNM